MSLTSHFTQDIDVLDAYYTKNRQPRPPSPSDLAAVRRNHTNAQDDTDESDQGSKPRSKRYSKTPKDANSPLPMQVGFYPPKWKDFIEECKIEIRTYTAIRDPWPRRREMLNGFILDTITMVVSKWSREERLVERGYYPEYKNAMGELVRWTSTVLHMNANYFSSSTI